MADSKAGGNSKIRRPLVFLVTRLIFKTLVGLCRCTRPLLPSEASTSRCECKKNLLKMSKFPNHRRYSQIISKIEGEFLPKLSLSKLTIIDNGYLPDISSKFFVLIPKNISSKSPVLKVSSRFL